MKLSVIVPVYNEKELLPRLLKKVEDVKGINKEIIIVDDGSSDGTRDFLETVKMRYKVVFHKKNQGKGGAIRTGLKYATGDIIIIQDADLEYDPNDYYKLIEPILKKKTKVVYGYRSTTRHNARYKLYYIFLLGNIFLNFITRMLYFRKITDMETCYKVFASDVIKGINLKAKRFDFEPEITAKIIKKGYKIVEVPIRYECRSFKEGKKIKWGDGVKAIWCLLKYRFVD